MAQTIPKRPLRFPPAHIFDQDSRIHAAYCFAQSSELKGWSSLEYGFEINESLKIDLSQHFRLKEDLNVVDTYITESEISYEPINDLKLLGQLRYYSRNDNFGGIQGFENMMRYRFGIVFGTF